MTHVTDLDGIEEAFGRLRTGEGARTVVLVDPELAGTSTAHERAVECPRTRSCASAVFSAPVTDAAAVGAAVGRAAAAQPEWAALPVAERARALHAFAAAVEADAGRLGELLVREVGKRRADADGEVAWTARSARYYADHPPAEERAAGARVVRRPIGVVAAITPWNVPLVTPAWKWLPALVAGNAVLWKPSERATAIAVAAGELLHAAGIPEAVLQVLPGEAATAQALAADERVGALHFTGSEAAGRALAALAAPRFARVALELSGINPAIVLGDADLDLAADCIVACGTALAGQKCTATRRVLVDETVAGELTREARRADRRAAGRRPARSRHRRRPADRPGGPRRGRGRGRARRRRPARGCSRAPTRPRATRCSRRSCSAGSPAATRCASASCSHRCCRSTRSRPRRRPGRWPTRRRTVCRPPSTAAIRPCSTRPRRACAPGVLALNRRGDDVDLEAPFGGRGRSGNGQPEGGEYVYGALTDLQAVYG